jgi:hypothetical protein
MEGLGKTAIDTPFFGRLLSACIVRDPRVSPLETMEALDQLVPLRLLARELRVDRSHFRRYVLRLIAAA